MPRILVIIVAVIIMLAGAAVTVMQQLEIGPFAPKEPAAATPEEGSPPPPGTSLTPPKFVSMEPLVIPIVFGERISGTVQLQVQLETSAEKESELKQVLPRVSDAFVRDLHGYLPRLLRDKQQLDVDLIKRRLMIIAERAVGQGLVDNVLIQSAIDRPAAR